MGFFKKKEEKKEAKSEKPKKDVKKSVSSKPSASRQSSRQATKTKKDVRDVPSRKPTKKTSADVSWVLLSPRITERSATQSEQKIYVFNIHPDANKSQVKDAIAKKFDVVPLKINITKIASKPVFRRGVKGKKAAGKKAYVYLSKKDSIQFV